MTAELHAAWRHDFWVTCQRQQGQVSVRSEWGEELLQPYETLSEAAKDLARLAVGAPVNGERLTVSQAVPPLENRAGRRDPMTEYQRALTKFERQSAQWDRIEAEYEARGQARLRAAMKVQPIWSPPERMVEAVALVAKAPYVPLPLSPEDTERYIRDREAHAEQVLQNRLAGMEKARLTRLRKKAENVEALCKLAVKEAEAQNARVEALRRLRAQEARVDAMVVKMVAMRPKPRPSEPEPWPDLKRAQWLRANGVGTKGWTESHRSRFHGKHDYGTDSQPNCSLRSMPFPVPWSSVPVYASDLPIVTAPEWKMDLVDGTPPKPPVRPWLTNRVRRNRRHRKPVGDASAYAELVAREVERHEAGG